MGKRLFLLEICRKILYDRDRKIFDFTEKNGGLEWVANIKNNGDVYKRQLLLEEQMTQNLLPCSFYGITRTLAPGGSVTLYELIGQVENKQLLKEYFAEKKDAAYFKAKKREADELAEALTDGICTRTASAAFDASVSYTHLDVYKRQFPIRS